MESTPYKSFLLMFFFLILMDSLWMGLIAKSFYSRQLSPFITIENGKINVIYWAAGLVYLLLTVGILAFVFPAAQNFKHVCFLSGVFGFIVYGIYEFTNYAIIKNWTLDMVIVDILWGTFLCASAAGFSWRFLNN